MGANRSKLKKYNVVDLFCGVGGLTLGFDQTKRFSTIFANDVDNDMCQAYKLNFPEALISDDSIADIDFKEISKKKKIE